jgi:hypothetical protein
LPAAGKRRGLHHRKALILRNLGTVRIYGPNGIIVSALVVALGEVTRRATRANGRIKA